MRTPDSPENYNAFKDSQRRQNEKRQQFRVVAWLKDNDSSPDSDRQVAERVAKQTGGAPAREDIVRAYRDLFREADNKAWAERVGKEAPITLASMGDPRIGLTSRSDAEALADVEKNLSKIVKAPNPDGAGAPLPSLQLASAPISVLGPNGRMPSPPIPVPDPRRVVPTPRSDPRDTLPLPDPRKSPALPTQPEGQENATAAVVAAPADVPGDGGASLTEGAGQVPAAEGTGAQTPKGAGAPVDGVSEGGGRTPLAEGSEQASATEGAGPETSKGTSSGGKAAPMRSDSTASAFGETKGKDGTSTTPIVEGKPSANIGGSETTSGQTASAVEGGGDRDVGGKASGEAEGQDADAWSVGGGAVVPGKATQASSLGGGTEKEASASLNATQAPSSANEDMADQPEVAASAGQVGEEVGPFGFSVESRPDTTLLVDIAFAKEKSPEEQAEIRARIYNSSPSQIPRLVDMYEGALHGVDPLKLIGDLSPELMGISSVLQAVGGQNPDKSKLYYYLNAIDRSFSGLSLSELYKNAEKYAQISLDKDRSIVELYKDEWSMYSFGAAVPVQGEPNLSPTYAGNRYAGLSLLSAFGALKRWGLSRLESKDALPLAKQYFEDAAKVQAHIEALPLSPEATRFMTAMDKLSDEPSVSVQTSKLTSLVKEDPWGALALVAERGVEGVPVLLVQSIAVALTKKPMLGVGLNILAAEQQAHATAALKFIKDKGFNIQEPGEIGRLLNAPDVLREAERLGDRRALLAVLVAAASGRLGSENLLADIALKQVASPLLAMGGEALGEIYSGEQLKVADIAMAGALDFVNNSVSRGVDVVTGKALANVKIGWHDYISLQKMVKDGEGSNLRIKNPDAYEMAIAEIVRGHPNEKIFLGIREIDFALKRLNINEDVFLAGLKGVTKADLEAARQVGGDIQIPTEVYLTRIAYEPIGVQTIPFARFGLNGVSGVEARALANWLKESQRSLDESLNDVETGTPASVMAPSSEGGKGTQPSEGAGQATATTDPSGTTSQGSSSLAAGATSSDNSRATVVPQQTQTLPIGGREFMDSTSPEALVPPEGRLGPRQFVPQAGKLPPEALEPKAPTEDHSGGHRTVRPEVDPHPNGPSKKTPKLKDKLGTYDQAAESNPVQELLIPPAGSQSPELFLYRR